MKVKAFPFLALVGLSLVLVGSSWRAALDWYGAISSYIASRRLVPLKTSEVRQRLQKCSSETEIQAEVDSLFIRIGDNEWRSLDGADLSSTPGLVRFSCGLRYLPLWTIVSSDHDAIGVPRHVELRFGQHFHPQYVLFFPTGSDLSSLKSPYEQVTKNVYFKP
jgi:hypothetical protein